MCWIGAGGWWRKPGGKEKKIEGKARGHILCLWLVQLAFHRRGKMLHLF